MQIRFQHHDALIVLDIESDGEGWRVRLPDGAEHRLVVRRLPNDLLQLTTHDPGLTTHTAFRVATARTERGIELSLDGETYLFTTPDSRPVGRAARPRSSGALTATMVGMVAEVKVEEGQEVEAYQPLVVVEAMKVMATVEAPFAGTVRKVYVAKNQRVAHGETLVDIAPRNGG